MGSIRSGVEIVNSKTHRDGSLDGQYDPRLGHTKQNTTRAILELHASMCGLATDFMIKQGFRWIHTPRLTDVMIRGDDEFFALDYFGKRASLNQATQFHKQMLLGIGFDRVFDIGSLFRAERRLSSRHMAEFTGLEFEMVIEQHHDEAMDVVEALLLHIVTGLQSHHKYREAVSTATERADHDIDWFMMPADGRTPRMKFLEAKAILRTECGLPEVNDDENFTASEEAVLGQYMRRSHQTDIFTTVEFPSRMRSFYSVPEPKSPGYARAFDVILRGQEVVSGSQHIHDLDQMRQAMQQHDPPLDPNEDIWKHYLAAFKSDMPMHAGCGVGMDRVLQGFLGLKDVRDVTAFPRDALTLAP